MALGGRPIGSRLALSISIQRYLQSTVHPCHASIPVGLSPLVAGRWSPPARRPKNDVIRSFRFSAEESGCSSLLFRPRTLFLFLLLGHCTWYCRTPAVMFSRTAVRSAVTTSRSNVTLALKARATSPLVSPAARQWCGPLPNASMGGKRFIAVYGYTQAKALVYSRYGEPKDVLQ